MGVRLQPRTPEMNKNTQKYRLRSEVFSNIECVIFPTGDNEPLLKMVLKINLRNLISTPMCPPCGAMTILVSVIISSLMKGSMQRSRESHFHTLHIMTHKPDYSPQLRYCWCIVVDTVWYVNQIGTLACAPSGRIFIMGSVCD